MNLQIQEAQQTSNETSKLFWSRHINMNLKKTIDKEIYLKSCQREMSH